MGAFLLAAGAKGKRVALRNSRIMIHQPLGGFQGQVTDVEIHAREMRRTKERLNQLLAEHTGKDINAIESNTERDNFMTSEEALEFGLIDRVVTKRPAQLKNS